MLVRNGIPLLHAYAIVGCVKNPEGDCKAAQFGQRGRPRGPGVRGHGGIDPEEVKTISGSIDDGITDSILMVGTGAVGVQYLNLQRTVLSRQAR